MSMLVPHESSILVSSDPNQGAINRSADGSSFEIQLDEKLSVPKDAMNVTLAVEESTVWWTVPNILTGQNDLMYIFGDDQTLPVPVPQLYVIAIPQGLYDLTALNNSIQSQLEIAGARVLDAGGNPLSLISLSADNATQKVNIRFNYPNVTVDFTQPLTTRIILGFDSLVYGPYVGAPLNVLAPNVAAFNQVNYFLIASDLVQKGIRFNNRYNQVIGQVLINVAPGSQIVSRPFNPARISADDLAGAQRTNLRFNLTDDSFRAVNTAGESWTARIVIRYLMPMVARRA